MISVYDIVGREIQQSSLMISVMRTCGATRLCGMRLSDLIRYHTKRPLSCSTCSGQTYDEPVSIMPYSSESVMRNDKKILDTSMIW